VIPLQHVHPMIVHFPIVLVFLVAGFEIVATALGRNVTGRTSGGNFAVGLLLVAAGAAIAAFYFGDLALSFAERSGFESDVAETHEALGRIVAIALPAWAAIRAIMWWRNATLSRPVDYLVPLVSIAGAGLITWTAYFGGQLVFDLGVNVAKVTGAA